MKDHRQGLILFLSSQEFQNRRSGELMESLILEFGQEIWASNHFIFMSCMMARINPDSDLYANISFLKPR